MGFRCFLNRKKAQPEPSRGQSRFSLCIFTSRSRPASPATRSTASQPRKRTSNRSGEMLLRSKDDEFVEVNPATPSAMRSSIAVELEEVFKKFDANGDGKVSSSELGDLMQSLGGNPTEEDLAVIVAAADLDGDGYIDLSEFLLLNTEGVDSSGRLEDLKAAFSMFDKDGNGTISPLELLHVLTSLQEPYTMGDCQAMISTFDSNGDGLINFEEFMAMMNTSDASSVTNNIKTKVNKAAVLS